MAFDLDEIRLWRNQRTRERLSVYLEVERWKSPATFGIAKFAEKGAPCDSETFIRSTSFHESQSAWR